MKEGLPRGWKDISVNDLFRIEYGKSLPKKSRVQDGNIPVYGSSGVTGYHDTALVPQTVLVVGRKGSAGAVYLTNSPSWPIDTVYYLSGLDDLDLRYFYWQLSHLHLGKLDRSTTIPSLSRDDLRSVHLRVAPSWEQTRIVAKIEELFSYLDVGVSALERAKANLKRYRASVLKAAVEGRLNRIKQDAGAFELRNWTDLGSVIASLGQGWSPKCDRVPARKSSEWGVIKTTAVQTMEYREEENKRLPAQLNHRPELAVAPGDILITRAGPRKRVGVCCLVKQTRPKLMICDKVYRVRCEEGTIRPAYLELVLNSPQVQDTIAELKTGISDSGVNLTQQRFKRIRIPVPSLETQQMVEDEVACLWSVAVAAENAIELSVPRVDRLRQGILADAFSGGLVLQDSSEESVEASLMRMPTGPRSDEPARAKRKRRPMHK